jgi:hypothetical protein
MLEEELVTSKTITKIIWLAGCFALGFYLGPVKAESIPQVTMKGGRYALYTDGERYKENGRAKYWNVDTTAKAAAVNLSFKCACAVTITQPDITVTTSIVTVVVPVTILEPTSIRLSWGKPVLREDGSELLSTAIRGYQIVQDDNIMISVDGADTLSYTVTGLTAGTYTFKIATVAEVMGRYSETIQVAL